MTERPFESLGDFHRWRKEQDALPINRDGKLCDSELAMTGWLGRDGSFCRKADDLMRVPMTWFSPSTEPLREWKTKLDYAAADLQQALEHFADLKSVALNEPGTAGRRWEWRPTYGHDTGLDYEAGLRQLVEAIRIKRTAFERLDSDPPMVIVKQREAAAAKAAQDAEFAENARRHRESRLERIKSIQP